MAIDFQGVGLGNVRQIQSTAGSLIHNDGNKYAVKGLVIHNPTSATETLEIYYVPNSGGSLGSAATANRIAKFTVVADETISWSLPYMIILNNTNDAIFCKGTTNNGLNILPTGDKIA